MRKFLFTLFSLVPLLSFAYDFKDGEFFYTITSIADKTVEVAKCPSSLSGAIEIPSTAKYGNVMYSVTRIGEEAFYCCDHVTSVKLPSSIKEIGFRAFYYCGLTSISLNEGLAKIDSGALSDTKLNTIIVPNTVKTIGSYAFEGNNLLTHIELPKDLTCISSGLFSGCSSLKECLIPNSVTKIESSAFASCYVLSNLTIPDNVTEIGRQAFWGCRALSKIVIPNNVTEIGSESFSSCSMLSSVTLGSSLSKLGSKSFSDCHNLKEIISYASMPPSTSEDFVNNVTYLDATVYVPDGCIESYKNTSPWKNFLNIIVYDPDNIDSSKCKVIINGPVLYEGEYCTEIDIAKGTKLNFEIVVPFKHELFSVKCNNSDILDSVVDEKYFSIIVEDVITTIDVDCAELLRGDFREKGFYYEILSDSSVRLVSGYKCYTGNVSIPDKVVYDNITYSVISIGKETFKECNGLTSIKIPESVIEIGDGAFCSCSSLKSIEIPDGVKEIPSFAFDQCENLTSIKFPSGLVKIGSYAFNYCTSLLNIDLPSSLTTIGDYAFSRCKLIKSLIIPENVIDLWWSMGTIFDCTSLKKVTFLGQVAKIQTDWFRENAGLKIYYMYATVPPYVGTASYGSSPIDKTLYVPEESVNLYKTADFWKNFKHIEPINNSSSILTIDRDDNIFTADGMLFNPKNYNIRIYNIQGTQIYIGNNPSIRLETGIYLVRLKDKMFKIKM